MWEIRDWLFENHFYYFMFISLGVIFTLLLLYWKISWKKCLKVYAIAFGISAGGHYVFDAILYHIPPGDSWHILSMGLIKEGIIWAFKTLIIFIFLKIVFDFLYLYKIQK